MKHSSYKILKPQLWHKVETRDQDYFIFSPNLRTFITIEGNVLVFICYYKWSEEYSIVNGTFKLQNISTNFLQRESSNEKDIAI